MTNPNTTKDTSLDPSLLAIWVSWTPAPVVAVFATTATATETVLSADTPPSFSEWDRTNGKMQSWVAFAKEWMTCMYMGHQCEVIQSWSEKLLMLSEISIKNQNRKGITKAMPLLMWMNDIDYVMDVPWLEVMSKDQMSLITERNRIFPRWYVYISSSYLTDPSGYVLTLDDFTSIYYIALYSPHWLGDIFLWEYTLHSQDEEKPYEGFPHPDFLNYPVAFRCVVKLS